MKLTEERKEEVLSLCKMLISIRSYSGEEKGVNVVKKMCRLISELDKLL